MSRGRAPFSQVEVDRLRRLHDTHGIMVAAEIAGTTPNGIRIVRKRGWTAVPAKPERPIPTDFLIQCDRMTLLELARHYNAGTSVVVRWARQAGRASMLGRGRKLPVPADLAMIVGRLGLKGAASHYGVGEDTLCRWRREAGLPIKGDPVRGSVGWVERYVAGARA